MVTEVTRLDHLEADVRRLRSRYSALSTILIIAIVVGVTGLLVGGGQASLSAVLTYVMILISAGIAWYVASGGRSVASAVLDGQDDGLRVLRGTGLEIMTSDGRRAAVVQGDPSGSSLQLFGCDGEPRVSVSVQDKSANVIVRGEAGGKYENHFAELTVNDAEGPKFRVCRTKEADAGPEDRDEIWAAP